MYFLFNFCKRLLCSGICDPTRWFIGIFCKSVDSLSRLLLKSYLLSRVNVYLLSGCSSYGQFEVTLHWLLLYCSCHFFIHRWESICPIYPLEHKLLAICVQICSLQSVSNYCHQEIRSHVTEKIFRYICIWKCTKVMSNVLTDTYLMPLLGIIVLVAVVSLANSHLNNSHLIKPC